MPSTSPQPFVDSGSATPRDPVPMLDLTRQYETIKDDVHAAIEGVLTSQHFIGGPELEGFERESASYLGVKRELLAVRQELTRCGWRCKLPVLGWRRA